jgi:hypothetical protein
MRQRPFDRYAIARDDAVGRELCRPGQRPPLVRPVEQPGALLEQRLFQVSRGDADVLPECQQLRFGESVADVALSGL